MNRLQKKCLIAVAGTHSLLVVVLFCSGFISSKPKPDDSQVLTVIPDTLIDVAFNSGVRHAEPPPPQPAAQPQPQPPTPEPPKPVAEPPKAVEPVKPEPEPRVAKAEEPVETKPKTEPHKVEVSLKPVVRKTPTETNNTDEQAKATEKAAKLRAQAVKRALNNIEKHATSATTVDMPGDSTVAYANYAAVVKTVYTEAWILPDTAASDEANVKVSVTIARDGHVIDAHIVDRSGDASMDRSVQETLDRVTEIRPFPDDSTDQQRTYIINFNLKAKRMLG